MKDKKVWIWIAFIIFVVIAAVTAMNQNNPSDAFAEDQIEETAPAAS